MYIIITIIDCLGVANETAEVTMRVIKNASIIAPPLRKPVTWA